ncbi:hypothetical protein JW899_03760 [Candidatus Uhrbacteria bacterium]|nr:hypothetical protein [Candidatus Uhrbacteria bacterium]
MFRFQYEKRRLALVIPAVFTAFVSGAVILGFWMSAGKYGHVDTERPFGESVPAVTVPTADEYRSAFRKAVAPLFAAAGDWDRPVWKTADVAAVREDLMSMTVPAGEREAHLRTVLFLDGVLAAADGSDGAWWEETVLAAGDLIADYPWMAEAARVTDNEI